MVWSAIDDDFDRKLNTKTLLCVIQRNRNEEWKCQRIYSAGSHKKYIQVVLFLEIQLSDEPFTEELSEDDFLSNNSERN